MKKVIVIMALIVLLLAAIPDRERKALIEWSRKQWEQWLPHQETTQEMIERVRRSAVTVLAHGENGKLIAQGSGFFVRPPQSGAQARVITNRHVMEGAFQAEVLTRGGEKYKVRYLTAENRASDLVVLSVSLAGEAVPSLSLARALPKAGEKVFVIGSPVGMAQIVTDGVASEVRDIPQLGVKQVMPISASLMPGSSGSPVVNERGEVVGVATFVIGDEGRIGFAMPVSCITAIKRNQPRLLSEWTKAGRTGALKEPAQNRIPETQPRSNTGMIQVMQSQILL